MKTHYFICLLVGGSLSMANAQNIDNPVLPGVADAGVVKYNGKYYIGGVNTFGDFYVSDDLVHWGKPVHVVSMDNEWTKDTGAGDNQIHANNMLYLNGQFHLYWSVNYWGKDRHAVHIVHAQSDDVLGPYKEPVKATWMDNRIDPHVFKDDDGQLYMYMVRFTDGNTIWGRKMKNPEEFAGEPVCQFASLPDTWETMDNRVAEGPWVIKYRGRYYMMYNANHTATDWGNYQLGVAEADSPLTFQNGGKYSYPVVKSNQVDLEEDYPDILRLHSLDFAYTEQSPEYGWEKTDFDDTDWMRGETGFSSVSIEGSTVRKQKTVWKSARLWLRKNFMAGDLNHNYALRVNHAGATKIYLNGSLIYQKDKADYCILNLDEAQLKNLRNGNNLLAVETSKGEKGNFFDVALFDMDGDKAENILFSPGQPNIVRGVNGFEWWLVYMANKNAEARGQYIDRIHFFDKTLYVDGITDKKTEGYHPEPGKPTYSDVFDDAARSKNHWHWEDGSVWTVADGELTATPSALSQALIKDGRAACTYLFEVGVNTQAEAGATVWWKDKRNYMRIGLDAGQNIWYLLVSRDGVEHKQSFPLPSDFKWGVYHSLRTERNMDCLKVWIDEIPAPGQFLFTGLTDEAGIPGVFSVGGPSAFDGVTYTIGFDDFDAVMPHWETLEGSYVQTDEGLQTQSEKAVAIKGELLEDYEFDVQITNHSDEGTAGILPLYIDSQNYVKVGLDAVKRQLEVVMVKEGKAVQQWSRPLAHLQTLYADVKYTDFIEKGYRMPSPTWLDAVYLNRRAVDGEDGLVENMFSNFNIEYLKQGKWCPLPIKNVTLAENPMYNKAAFEPIKAEGFRFVNRNAEDLKRHIYKIRIGELFKDSYNVRAVRRKNKLYLFVDGREIGTFPVDYAGSRVGLYSENGKVSYNGILYYHIAE